MHKSITVAQKKRGRTRVGESGEVICISVCVSTEGELYIYRES